MGGGVIVVFIFVTVLGSYLLHKKRKHRDLCSHLLKNDYGEEDEDELHRQGQNVAAKAADKAVVLKGKSNNNLFYSLSFFLQLKYFC